MLVARFKNCVDLVTGKAGGLPQSFFIFQLRVTENNYRINK